MKINIEDIENLKSLFKDIKKFANKVLFGNLNNISNYKIQIAINAEAIELLENYNWKPWSKRNISFKDELNKKVEMIDIFILSFIYNIKNNPNFNNNKNLLNLIENFYNNQLNTNNKKEIDNIEKFILSINNSNPNDLLYNSISLLKYQFNNIKEIIYFTKSKIILSTFRNNMGYNNGEYIKTWNGLEDNHFMYMKILPKLFKKNLSLEEFQKELEKELFFYYNKIILNKKDLKQLLK